MVTDYQTDSGTPAADVNTSRRRLLQMMGATGLLAGIGTTGAVAADDTDTTDTEALPIDSRDLEVAVVAAKQAADIHEEHAEEGVEADTKAPSNSSRKSIRVRNRSFAIRSVKNSVMTLRPMATRSSAKKKAGHWKAIVSGLSILLTGPPTSHVEFPIIVFRSL